MENIKVIYKPKGLTSHDIVDKVRKEFNEKKVGHAGTLDPLAEGVLVVGIGREGTKQIGKLVGLDKEYIAEIKLGEISETDDAEGKKTFISNEEPSRGEIEEIIPEFIGNIEQIPPAYSAAKVKGVRAYKRARRGESFNPGVHHVEVKDIEILEYKYPILKLKITTGSGVYIRSIARDMGERLKTGAFLYSLLRTKVGDYKIENSLRLDI